MTGNADSEPGATGLPGTIDMSGSVRMAVAELSTGESPRGNRLDDEHVRYLAGIDPGELPPIVVHRQTHTVIDGMHRLAAAEIRGAATIRAVFFDGTEGDAFVLGVRLNARHGLPLSLAERSSAAVRIFATHPTWSNRMIAEIVGLADKTVATIRRERQWPPAPARIGKDGRVRPVDPARRRERVRQLLADNPDASLRSIARQAGVAVETVRRIRTRTGPGPGSATQRRPRSPEPITPAEALRILKNDPALRLSATNRALLRLFDARFGQQAFWQDIFANVPSHCADMVAELARQYSAAWLAVAEQLDQQGTEEEIAGKRRPA